jgi:hypothetical protein
VPTDRTNDEKQIQMAVSATFSTTFVPTDIRLGTTIEMPAPPLAGPGEGPAEASDQIIESLPLVVQDESLAEASDGIDEWVRDIRDSTARTLELSKRLDDLLARPIRWYHRDGVEKGTAVKSAPDCEEH